MDLDMHDPSVFGVNISPCSAKHVRATSSASSLSTSSSLDDYPSSAPSIIDTSSYSPSRLSSLLSPPLTPRSPLPEVTSSSSASTSHLHRYSSHGRLSDFSTDKTPGRNSLAASYDDPDDRFTQMPMLSPRERRRSSMSFSAQAARRRKSQANLRKEPLASATEFQELVTATPEGIFRTATPTFAPLDGPLLSRKHIEASRRAAKEALEEDLRASNDSVPNEAFAYCYFTSLDYLVKAIKVRDLGQANVKTSKAIRSRLLALASTLVTEDELEAEKVKRQEEIARALQALSKPACSYGESKKDQILPTSPFLTYMLGLLGGIVRSISRHPLSTLVVSMLFSLVEALLGVMLYNIPVISTIPTPETAMLGTLEIPEAQNMAKERSKSQAKCEKKGSDDVVAKPVPVDAVVQ